jgi:hypothetical protein
MSEEVKAKSEKVLEEAEGFSEKEKDANRPAEKPRDWVGETVKCFIKDATGIDPTDPISAIAEHFAKNATDELKAKCKAEGKNATLCWKFIEAVARKALGGRNGHIDPAVVYAIAMHWFEDVPKDWDGQAGKVAHTPRASAKTEKAKKPKKPAETPSEVKKEKAKAKKAAKPKQEQGFFFDLLETPQESEAKE